MSEYVRPEAETYLNRRSERSLSFDLARGGELVEPQNDLPRIFEKFYKVDKDVQGN